MDTTIKNFFKNKKILITGAAGTVGREITRQLCSYDPSELRLVDNNETGVFYLMEEYKNHNVFCFIGDVRDSEKIERLSKNADIIIHCAAFKHVILSEYNPFDVVQTNINGVENIIKAAIKNDVSHVLFTSSDKAVNPTNVMGTSKLMGERLITAANAKQNSGKTIFSSTRFGNVIGSRGSVLPLFMRQIKNAGPVTVTDKHMTRFIMSIEQSASLVLKSLTIARGGEVLVTKMPVMRIPDLAEVVIDIFAPKVGYKPSDIQITEIGTKPGEKLYEELMSDEEVHRSIELPDMFVITPAFKAIYQTIEYTYPDIVAERVNSSYVSLNEKPLTKEQIKAYLLDNNIIDSIERSYGAN